MASIDICIDTVPTPPASATASRATALPALRGAGEYAAVTGAWAAAVIVAAVLPNDGAEVSQVALFIHLMSMAIGFGAVIMIDAFGLLWLFGRRTLAELVDLDTVAHTVIAVAVGGLLASGVALQPDLATPLARFKMLLVLGLMLNGLAAQRMLQRFRRNLPPATRGDSIPWRAFQRGVAAAMISQATWWGAIAIGFLTNAGRHSVG